MSERPPPSIPTSPGAYRHSLADLVRDLLPVTQAAGGAGSPCSLETMLPQVYDELRTLAAGYLRRERPDHTLQPTALVHEVYLRLAGDKPVDWQDRAHFLGIAARVMRRVLIDSAKSRSRDKRGGGASRLTLDVALELFDDCTVSVDGVDEALRALEEIDPRQGKIVELRFFGGLTTEEISEVLQVSCATVKREWATAKLWLKRELDCHAG